MSIALVNKFKRSPQAFVFLALIILVVFIFGVVFYGQLGAVDTGQAEDQIVVIKSGATPGQIAQELKSQGLIKNVNAFLIYARLSGQLNQFKAGHYLLNASWNVPEMIEILAKGKVRTVSFTIPEGYHLRQIAEVLSNQEICTSEAFWRAVKDEPYKYDFLQGLPNDERRLEGYLFPDTYTVPVGMRVEKVLEVMLKRFDQVYKKMPSNQTGLSRREVVILASMVEGEALLDVDRPLIASVFLNRLRINMKLDSCATIQYLFEKRKERLLYQDLEIDSPYNTYRYRGLPPGPIGSPGEASLRAVFEPAATNYLYFVAKKDGSGEHVFAATLAGHNQNKRSQGY